MKKNISFCLILACVFALPSCKKDGVFNPKKKISKTFHDSNSGKELSLQFEWNKNTLEKLYYSYDRNTYELFTYNKQKQLVKRTYIYDGMPIFYSDFTYEKGKLSKIMQFYENILYCETKVSHDGSKISKLDITYYDVDMGKSSKSLQERSPLSTLFVDPTIAQVVEKKEKKMLTRYRSNAKGSTATMNIAITWNKDNISKLTYNFYNDGDYDSGTTEFTYDDKRNPFYGFLGHGTNGLGEVVETCLSKNNVLTITNDDGYHTSYTYTYDEKYPTMQISSDGHTYYYEYED